MQKTLAFTYDDGGNMLTSTVTDAGGITTVTTFGHDDSTWYDLLTSVNGTPITHDAMGNLTGDGTWSYTWTRGRQLKRMQKTGMTVEYAYDCAGLRTSKTVAAAGTITTTKYIRNGKYLTHMTDGINTLHFCYDAMNRPVFVDFNGTVYGYWYSMQGDVLGLYDSTGTLVVEYLYDAWGAPLGTSGSLASTLGVLQPFRYRGYEFDTETGLYYLRARYYRAGWGRFISADVVIEGNLYGYCRNIPTGRIDINGTEDSAYSPLDRKWLREYGKLYYDSPDNRFPQSTSGNNCARFVSQCLWFFLGQPYYEEWHAFDENGNENVTSAWKGSTSLYRFLKKEELVYDEHIITKNTNIQEMVQNSTIGIGDVLFIRKDPNSSRFDHAMIVSDIRDGYIYYMANTRNCFDEPISRCFQGDGAEYEVHLLCIRGNG